MAETRVIITAEANQAIQEFSRLRAEATGALGQIGRSGAHLDQMGVSAAQTAQALRQVPAQLTDIVVSLQAGQSPLTVFLQQGGQLRDMFGSAGGAARALGGYVLGLINPFSVAAAAGVTLALAYNQGANEAQAFNRALIESGNAAGTTASQLAGMAKAIHQATGETKGDAAAALAALVTTGRVSVENLTAFSVTASQAQKATVQGIDDTAKAFADLGKAPLQTALKLNEQFHFLTGALYAQIKALQDQGREEEAAELAQKAYSGALADRSAKMIANLGLAEKAWLGIKGAAKGAWDAMLDIGRSETPEDEIARLQAKIAKASKPAPAVAGKDVGSVLFAQQQEHFSGRDEARGNLDKDKARLAILQDQVDANGRMAAMAGARIKFDQDDLEWSKQITANLSRQDQLTNELEANKRRGLAAGASDKAISDQELLIRKKYSDIYNDGINSQIEVIKQRGAIEDAVARRSLDLLVAKNSVGLVSEEDFIKAVGELDDAAFMKQKGRLTEELALTAKKQNSQKDQAALSGQIAELTEQQRSRALQTENQLFELEVRRTRSAAANYADLMDKIGGTTIQLGRELTAQRDANAQIGLTKEGIAQLTAARLLERAALADQNAEIAEGVDFSGRLSEKYRQQASDLRALAKAQQDGAAAQAISDKFSPKDLEDFLDPTKAKSFGDALKDSFGGAGDAMTKLRVALQDYGVEQQTIDRARAAAAVAYAGDSAKLAAANSVIAKKETQSRINAYGDMAGAAKTFFKEHTAGYKLLEGAEKTFRAIELANQMEKLATSLFVSSASAAGVVAGKTVEVGAVTAGEAAMNAAKVPGVFMSFMSALGPWGAAAAAVAIAAVLGGAFSGGGSVDISKQRQETQGTGSVLGNESAKSESIGRSIENLEKYASVELSHTRDMLTALVRIRDTIGVVAAMATQTAGLRATALDEKKYGVGSSSGVLGIGASSTSIQDSGIKLNGSQTIGSAIGSGVDATGYADILKKSSGLWGIGASSHTRRDVIALDDDLKKQFGLLVASMRDGTIEAVKVLGLSTDGILDKINGMALGIDEISFKGLTGDEIEKELEAVFSKVGDDIAKLAVPELAKFQQVGEGYLETLTRVATDYATLDSIMEASGRTFGAVGLSSVEARERLIKLGGGLDALISSSQSFNENFLSEAEQLAPVQKYVTAQLAAMGLQAVTTREQFKNVVLSLDVTTEAGAKQYTTLLALADAFAKTHEATEVLKMTEQELKDQRKDFQNQYDELMLTTAQLAAKARAAIEPYNLVLYDQIQAQTAVKAAQDTLLDAYTKQKSALQAVVDLQLSAAAATEKEVNALKLGTLSDLSPERKYLEAKRQFDAAAPGDAKNAAAQALLDASRAYNGSTEAYSRDYAKVQATLALQAAAQSSAASVAKQQLNAMNSQVGKLIDIKAGVDTLDGTTKAVRDAILGLTSATAAAAAANTAAGNAAGGSGQSIEAMVAGIYKDVLGRQGDEAGMAFWSKQIKNGASYSQIYDALKNSDEYKYSHGIKAHAKGGIASGWSLVGEEGAELVNFDQPARVYTASQSRQMMSGGGASDAVIAAQTAAIERQSALLSRQNELLESIKDATEDSADKGASSDDIRSLKQHMAKAISQKETA